MGGLSRSQALRGNAEAPRRGGHRAGVHHSYTREPNLPAVRRYPVRPGRHLLWPLPTAGHGVRKPSGRRRSQPDRSRRAFLGRADCGLYQESEAGGSQDGSVVADGVFYPLST